MRRTAATAIAALLGTLALAPAAPAASRLVVTGHGYGHGIGMSQYGALGYAQHGSGYKDILDHRMPDVTGMEVARTLVSEGFDTPIVIFSAYLDPELEADAAALTLFPVDKLDWPILELGARAGGLTAEAAAWTGLPEGIAVAAGNVDAHVTIPAAQAVEPGRMVAPAAAPPETPSTYGSASGLRSSA